MTELMEIKLKTHFLNVHVNNSAVLKSALSIVTKLLTTNMYVMCEHFSKKVAFSVISLTRRGINSLGVATLQYYAGRLYPYLYLLILKYCIFTVKQDFSASLEF